MNSKKKAGLITAGVVTALVAASPLAFATDKGDHGHGHGHGPHGDAKVCNIEGGDGGAGSLVGGGLINAVVQAPVAGNNIANIGNCSEFLNDNLNDNVSDNNIGVLSGPIVDND